MATNVTITSNYIPDNTNNSDTSTIVVSGGGESDTAQEILTKLLTVDSDDSGLNANTLQGKTAADFATNASVAAAVAALVDSSPAALDTLNELAAAIGDDPNFATTVTNALSNKVDSTFLVNQQLFDANTVTKGFEAKFFSGANQPANTTDGALLTLAYNQNWAVQLFGEWRTKDLYLRSQQGGTWKTWAKIWHSENSNLPSVDWTAKNINANGLIKAYRYPSATNLPAITMDKSGSYAYGIGPDGTNMRIRYGTAALDGSSWNTTGNAGIEHFLDGKVTVTGDIQGDTTFISGFQGSGMRLNKDANNKYNLELDNLTIRGGMSVYELTANKVRATNGALYVSDSNKIKSVDVLTSYYVIYQEDINTFIAGDIVKCQIFTGTGVKSYTALIDYVDNSRALFTLSFSTFYQGGTGANVPAVGDTIVRIGNNTDTNRQGTIYLTSSDTNSPYIQVVDGATSANLSGDVKVRLGKLDGITSTYFGNLSGYGLFTNNAILDNARVSGNISADSGNIGGFDIASSSLSTNYVDLNNTTKSIDLYNTNSNVNSGIRFYYGEKNATPSYIARLNAYRHGTDGDIFSIFVSNKLNISANDVKMSGNLTVNGTTTANYLSVINTTTNDLYVNNNTIIYGSLSVHGITHINIPTFTLTYNTTGAWASFSSLTFNGRREGKVNNLNLTFYSSNSSSSWQKLGTITNYVSTDYDVYFTPTTGTGTGENSSGYIATTGEIFIKPGKSGQNYYGQVTWITA